MPDTFPPAITYYDRAKLVDARGVSVSATVAAPSRDGFAGAALVPEASQRCPCDVTKPLPAYFIFYNKGVENVDMLIS